MKSGKKPLSAMQRTELLAILEARFEKNMRRHERLTWPNVHMRLEA
jgi:hypothetical protein